MNHIYVRINVDLYNYKAGTILRLECCNRGIPMHRQWRKRFCDSVKDNCLTVLKRPTQTAKDCAMSPQE